MSYLVLARKYRPQVFDDVYSQEHITRTLQNAIKMSRVAHAFLFTGPRGVGKTSLARILAKSMNCEHGPTPTPCNVCVNCVETTTGNAPDVIEIDGASNNSVDNVRDLQEELLYSASKGKFKIYIIDEVHMLSKSAFNALLKTLEEPPPNVIFIFATTDPQKVPATIISRCQRYDFKRIPLVDIVKRLEWICGRENIPATRDALFVVAKLADGGMRDALSLLDQVVSYGLDKIDIDEVNSIFGLYHTDVFMDILESITKRNASRMVEILHSLLERGSDPMELINGLLDFLRNTLLVRVGVEVEEIPQTLRKPVMDLARAFSENEILYMMSFLVHAKQEMKYSGNPVLLVEMAFVKLAKVHEIQSVDQLIEAVKNAPRNAPQNDDYSDVARDIRQIRTDEVRKTMVREVHEEKPKISALTMEILQQQWETILKKIGREMMLVSLQLQEGKLLSVNDKIIGLEFDKKLAWEQVNGKKTELEQIIGKHLDYQVYLNITLKEAPPVPAGKALTLENIRQESPELAEFIELTHSQVEPWNR